MLKFIKSYRYTFLLLAFVYLEFVMFSSWRDRFGAHKSALLFFFASLAVGLIAMRFAFEPSVLQTKPARKNGWMVLPGLIAAIGAYFRLAPTISKTPVLAADSDIIPTINVMNQRWLTAHFPYEKITNWGYELLPGYLPLQWLPFGVAELLGIDYRVWGLILLLGLIIISVRMLNRARLSALQQLIFLIMSLVPLFLVDKYAPLIYVRTLETLIAGYYLLLGVALIYNRAWLIGLALVTCLLSRYAVVIWAPLLLFMYATSGQMKKASRIALICFLGVLLLYVAPFLWKDAGLFVKTFNYYSVSSLGEWKGQSWQAPEDKPYQLFRGFGMAGLIYDHYKGTVEEKLLAMRILHLTACCFTVLILGIWFYLKRKQAVLPVFALASLKIYLAVFYHLIQVPYDYLYLTLIYVSIPVVAISIRPLGLRSTA